jgi:hypothetical protein
VQRILVVGMSGAGKTTLASRLGRLLDLPFHELDALAFGPGWSADPGYGDAVARIAAGPAWVVDSWALPAARQPLWAAADAVVWLDYPARVVLPRVLRRSVLRTARREPVFGGNREQLRGWFDLEHPVWHAALHLRERRGETARLVAHHDVPEVVRLTTPRAAETWLQTVR